MLASFVHWIQDLVRTGGYPVVFVLILLESTLVPIPSEVVMPLAGSLAVASVGSHGEFSLPVLLIINSVAALIGSSLCYGIGVVGGKPFLVKYGKYFLLRQHDIERTEAFFAKHGKKTIFIGRFLPVIRHVISVPAGIGRMPLPSFWLQTFLGSTIWGGTLIFVGYYLGANWESLADSFHRVNEIVGIILVLAVVAWGIRFVLRRRRERAR